MRKEEQEQKEGGEIITFLKMDGLFRKGCSRNPNPILDQTLNWFVS